MEVFDQPPEHGAGVTDVSKSVSFDVPTMHLNSSMAESGGSSSSSAHLKVSDSSPIFHSITGCAAISEDPTLVDSSRVRNTGLLQRAKSALPPSKVIWSGLAKIDRSKSMPVSYQRRADIILTDETLAEVLKVHEATRASKSIEAKNVKKQLAESEISGFEEACERFFYGAFSLTGAPGQGRTTIGLVPHDVAVSCVKGLKGPADTSPNQDNYSYYKFNDYEFYSVQDGHGPDGHFVSYRGIRTLPLFVSRSQYFPNDMHAAIKEGYSKCHEDIVLAATLAGFDVQISGCACTLVVRRASKIWLSHAGDSRVVVGSLESPEVLEETSDHKPTNPEERTRLESCGSQVQTFIFENDVHISRVFVKGTDYPGLCMSRSLGDQCVKAHGVTADPDVIEYTGIPGQTYILLASDGVWEFVPSSLVCSSLSKRLRAEGKEKCMARIVAESKKRWKSNEGTYCDDITALMITL